MVHFLAAFHQTHGSHVWLIIHDASGVGMSTYPIQEQCLAYRNSSWPGCTVHWYNTLTSCRESFPTLYYFCWWSVLLRTGLCAGQWSSSSPNFFKHVFMDLSLCSGWVQACWNRKGSFLNFCNRVLLVKIPLYALAITLTFNGTEEPWKTAQSPLSLLHQKV